MTYTAGDLINPYATPTLGGGRARYHFKLKDSSVMPQVGQSIELPGKTLIIRNVDQPNSPGSHGAWVTAE